MQQYCVKPVQRKAFGACPVLGDFGRDGQSCTWSIAAPPKTWGLRQTIGVRSLVGVASAYLGKRASRAGGTGL